MNGIAHNERADLPSGSTLIFTSYCISAFLVSISVIVIAVGASQKITSRARIVLCLFHLAVSIIFGSLLTTDLAFLLPPMFAVTGESLLFAGHAWFVRSHEFELLSQQRADEQQANIRLLQIDQVDQYAVYQHPVDYLENEQSVGDQLLTQFGLENVDSDEEEIELENAALPDDCVFSVQRFQTADAESYSGTARASFDNGNLNESIHIAFCPPFEQTPVAEVFQCGGVAATIKTAMIENFGMRIEIKRTANALQLHSDEDDSFVNVEFFVHAARQLTTKAATTHRQIGQSA